MIRVIIADDHEIMRDGLALILRSQPDVEIVGQAADGEAALALAAELRPDVIVMDVGMPRLNGIEATHRLLAEQPAVRVIALSALADRRYVVGMLRAGAAAYVVKSAAGDELCRALRAAVNGKKFISAEVAALVMGAHPEEDERASRLAHRECEVLQKLAEGMTSKEIASSLHISVRTVETHRRNIMQKLNLHNLADLTRFALKEGLTQLDQ
jgi:DNA-binding NarL/FixJ family response regulator